MYDSQKRAKACLKLRVLAAWSKRENPLPPPPPKTPITVELTFFLPRPASHLKAKSLAPFDHVQKPDLDNLAKVTVDAGNGRVTFPPSPPLYPTHHPVKADVGTLPCCCPRQGGKA